jgi:hypothetical protein
MYQGYVITGIKADGLRHMALNNDGRNVHKTRQAAEDQLQAIREQTDSKTIAETLGTELRIEPVECYDNGDAAQTVFKDK